MKNALILHGTEGSSKENWFPWLEKELVSNRYNVWVPDLPGSERPNILRYNEFIFSKWMFDSESVIVGHSSGATAILGLLQGIESRPQIDTAFLVAGFTGNLDWDALEEIGSYQFDWQKIKKKAKKFVLFHSDDDPYVSLAHGKFLKEKLGAELIILSGQKHFSFDTDAKYKKFPELLKKILE